MTVSVQISLGANLGDRRSAIESALARLDRRPGLRVVRVSSLREYPAVGGPSGQPPFLNGAASLESDIAPEDLLEELLEAERAVGRERNIRWEARTLDLDIILHGSTIIDRSGFAVPHPRFALRPFVLEPLAEIAPQAIDPLTGTTVSELLENLRRRPARLCVAGVPPGSKHAASILRDRLEPAGWVVVEQHLDPCPTFVVDFGAQRPGETDPPRRFGCPVYRPEPHDPAAAIDEVVAICLGIANNR